MARIGILHILAAAAAANSDSYEMHRAAALEVMTPCEDLSLPVLKMEKLEGLVVYRASSKMQSLQLCFLFRNIGPLSVITAEKRRRGENRQIDNATDE